MYACGAFFFFFCNDTATTEIYTLSLHDALPIYKLPLRSLKGNAPDLEAGLFKGLETPIRSEERFSRNAETDIVCRLLLVKKLRPFVLPPPSRVAPPLCVLPDPAPGRSVGARPLPPGWACGGSSPRVVLFGAICFF